MDVVSVLQVLSAIAAKVVRIFRTLIKKGCFREPAQQRQCRHTQEYCQIAVLLRLMMQGCHLEVARASEGGYKELRHIDCFRNVDDALKNRQKVRWQKELAQIEPEKVPCCAFGVS